MTLFHLVRHAHHGLLGTALAGRGPGVHLGETGRAQADALARNFAGRPIARILCSPMERTRETAAPIAAACRAPIEIDDALLEVDFGEWTGLTFGELDRREDWRAWNTGRSLARAPGGETVAEVQARACDRLHRAARDGPGETIVVVSHGDVIRSVLAYHLGIPIDLFLRLEVSPASRSVLAVDAWGPRVLGINETTGIGDGMEAPQP